MELVDLGRRAAGAILAYAFVVAVIKAGLLAAGLPSVAAQIPGGAPLDKLFSLAESGIEAVKEINGTILSPSGFIGAARLAATAIEILLYMAFMVLFGYVEIAIWIVSHVPPQFTYLAAMAAAGLAILQVAVIRWLIYKLIGR